ncbi:MAG: hypothetical protein CVU44_14665 [Chloroflexi bacterium HGW-Chloroflexi-6]|nr:MAG: hypothetical protein CVU44_14665 [Chloroflexi bacterium HGW-Chloroflexi-6]
MKRYKSLIPPVLLLASLLGVYLASLAPGLTWAHFGADGGDLITAAATGGVAHPSGYPTYLLLARLFQLLPVGSLAYRTNLLSAGAAALAALLAYFLAKQRLSGSDSWLEELAALAAGYALGLAPLFWSQALIAEVYTLHIFFVVLLLFLSFGLLPAHATEWRSDLLSGLALGVSLGNHLTSLLLLPVVLGVTFRSWRPDLSRLSLRLVGLALGSLVYLILPLSALSDPPLNWGNPASLDGFFWLVSAQLYRGQLALLPLPALLERVSAIAALLWGQFGLPGLVLGLTGLVSGRLSVGLQRSLLWISFGSIVFALIYTTSDSFLYLLPALLSFALWVGVGLHWLSEIVSERWPHAAGWIGIFFLLFIFWQAGMNWPQVDASADLRAEEFGDQILTTVPANALIVAEGDQAVFALWYFHFALGQRPDLIIVAGDLLHFPWYLETLQTTYPRLKIPGSYPFPQALAIANPERPTCTVRYERWTQLYCQPALGLGQ